MDEKFRLMHDHNASPYENAQVCRVFLQNFTGIAYRRGPDGRLDMFSGDVEDITGCPESSFLNGRDWADMVHPDDRPFLLATRERLSARPCAERLEYRIQTNYGALKWVSDLAKSYLTEDGLYIEGVIYDISDQKEAEAAMQILLESIVSRSGQDCLDYTVTEIKNWLSMDAALLLELTTADSLRPLAATLPHSQWPEALDPAGTLAEYLMANGPALVPDGVATRFAKPFGPAGLTFQSCLGAPLRNDAGEVIGLLCGMSKKALAWSNPLWLHMISLVATKASTVLMERQKALALTRAKELAEAESRAKSNFLIKTSRELRILLDDIQGSLHQIKSGPLEATQTEYLNLSLRSSEALLVLVNNILDISEVDSDQNTMKYKEITFHDLTTAVEKSLTSDQRLGNFKLDWNIEPDVPAAIITDPKRLKQLLTNVLAEASLKIDNPQFNITFHINIANYQYNFPFTLEITIIDNSIDPLTTDPVQPDPSSVFFISRRLVHLMGGEIDCNINEAGRSEIRLHIPVSIPQALLP